MALRVADDRGASAIGLHHRALGDRLDGVIGAFAVDVRLEQLQQALDIPIGTVKTHLYRAKRRLRELLQ